MLMMYNDDKYSRLHHPIDCHDGSKASDFCVITDMYLRIFGRHCLTANVGGPRYDGAMSLAKSSCGSDSRSSSLSTAFEGCKQIQSQEGIRIAGVRLRHLPLRNVFAFCLCKIR